MARMADLPVEIQTEIWAMVLPQRGGVQWVELEGVPCSPDIVTESLKWLHDAFDDKEPNDFGEFFAMLRSNSEYSDYWERADSDVRYTEHPNQSVFFKYQYLAVPSVWGQFRRSLVDTGEGSAHEQNLLDEINHKRRCRQLSSYSQVTTLLSTCRVSRLIALEYMDKIDRGHAHLVWRGSGPLYKPRSLLEWNQLYSNIERVPKGLDVASELIPKISSTLDLVVFRLHDASGRPTPVLTHAFYQLGRRGSILLVSPSLPNFARVGIEWHPSWATPEGRKNFSPNAVSRIMLLQGSDYTHDRALYWLVDGITRPQWDQQYPPAIPAAFSRAIERRKESLRRWNRDSASIAWKARVSEYEDLYRDFEANGRRYYIVFVISKWRSFGHLEETYLDPALDWDGPFPGGKELWPSSLYEPVQLGYDLRGELRTNPFCSFVLSWEPI